MRGKGTRPAAHRWIAGITPAYAGKSFSDRCHGYCTWDHPRVCGEKLLRLPCRYLLQGSPPRMRGKALPFLRTGRQARITPAYAGKSIFQGKVKQADRDHPRVCGEKPFQKPRCLFWVGSPPRMRGKVDNFWIVKGGRRITPAYAGKSVYVATDHPSIWDHPRVCGEK